MSDSTEGKDQHEPSMEEILASIRRIISEDGDGEAGDAAAAPKAEEKPAEAAAAPAQPAAASAAHEAPSAAEEIEPANELSRALAPLPEPEDESDILLLTEEVEGEDEMDAPPPPSYRESPLSFDEPPPEPRHEPELTFETEPEPEPIVEAPRAPEPLIDNRLISDRAAAASLAAMSELLSRSHREPNIESMPMGNANQTLEELTRELLRPILKSWLDDNLPQIVERIVREEIGRLALDAQRR
jgi:hypothetical protein